MATKEATRQLVVAITTGSVVTKDNPRGENFHQGETFEAGAEIVRRAPRYFMPVDSTSQERRQRLQEISEHPIAQGDPPVESSKKGEQLFAVLRR